MLTPDKQVERVNMRSSRMLDPALENYVPIQKTKKKRKQNEATNDGHSMMEQNV